MRLLDDEKVIVPGFCVGHVGEYAVFLTREGQLYVAEIPAEVAELGYMEDEQLLTKIEDIPEADQRMVNSYIERNDMQDVNQWSFVFLDEDITEPVVQLEERNIEKMEKALGVMLNSKADEDERLRAEQQVIELLGKKP
ncbi:MAG: hypothetical protein LIP16_20545 [Clostridium sp.]|nr:hypothetical protein [Clostridium sp.]